MTKTTKRYSIIEEIHSKYSSFQSEDIEEYYGIDEFYNQSVKIKTFRLPEKEEAKRLAITLWEREIRLIRKAMGISGGHFLLQLLDAFTDYDSGKLYLVSSRYGRSVEEWINETDGLWFLKDTNSKSRKEVWILFKSLLNGIMCLHIAKLLHRNIHPGVIFFSDESDENIFKIGGFTWSLYLHNLNFIPKKGLKQGKDYSLFQAPESFLFKKDHITHANPFAGDIFSLGMVICYIFYNNFPKTSFKNLNDWSSAYSDIKEFLSLPNSILNKSELDLINKCISQNPTERPKMIKDMLDIINDILEEFEEAKNVFTERPLVNWYNEANSRFLQKVALKTSTSTEEIRNNPDLWLSNNFTNAKVFVTGYEKLPLIVLTQTNVPFSLNPAKNIRTGKPNQEVMNLYDIYPEEARKIFTYINDKRPIGIFKNGFRYTFKRETREPQSPWRTMWNMAQVELKELKKTRNEEEQFIEHLHTMLKAENVLDSEKIISFKTKDYKRNPANEKEQAELDISLDFDKEMVGDHKRKLLEIIKEFKNRNKGLIELSASNSPSSYWDNYNQWSIRSINKNELKIQVERPIKKKNKDLLQEGVIRPFDMSMSFKLYRRKDQAIDYIRDNDLLLTAISNPWYRTFTLGIDFQIQNKIVSQILNTIPLYLVQGPPGTGKTWVASTVVANILDNNPYSRILISSKDHHPLDHLVEAVWEKIPENLDPKPIVIRTISSEKEQEYIETDFILKFTKERKTKEILKEAENDTNKIKTIAIDIENQWKNLIKENAENPSLRWTDEVLKIANIVFATSTSSAIDWLKQNAPPFDWVIVEEAAKSYPIELILPMNLGHRWLLIGDQKQLPPYKYKEMEIIISDILDEDQREEEKGDDLFLHNRNICLKNIKLFKTLFENFKTVKAQYSEREYNPCSLLEDQHRLPPLISEMISTIFYDTKFTNKKEAPIEGDPFKSPDFLKSNQLIWIDTPHVSINSLYGDQRAAEGSSFNISEINLIIKLVKNLEYNDKSKTNIYSDIVFLTPYSAQKENLASNFNMGLGQSFNIQELSYNCHTVDSYQGKQADIVIISLVRNNKRKDIKGALGFLIEEERLNVMFSRVRKRMVIIGCSAQFLQFKDAEECQAINQVFEFVKQNGKIIKSDILEGI